MKFEEIFIKRINHLTRSIISQKIIDLIIKLFFTLLISLFILSLVEISYNMSSLYRTAIMIIYMITIVFFSIRIFKKFLNKNLSYFYHDRIKYISLDHLYPNLNFLFIYDLFQIKNSSNGNDHTIIDSAINLNVNKFNSFCFPDIFNRNYVFKRIILPIATIVILMIPYNFIAMKDSLMRLINFNTEFYNPTTHELCLVNKNFTIIQGIETTVLCKVLGLQQDQVQLHKRPIVAENYSSVSISLVDSLATYKDKATQSFYYYFSSEEVNSDTGFVKVLKRPEINNLKLRIDYPSYTKLKSEYYQDFIGSITVLKGSSLDIDSEPSHKMDSLKIFLKNKSGLSGKRLIENETHFEYSTKIYQDTEFYFKLFYSADSLLVSNEDPIVHKVNILSDNYPIVNLILPEDNFKLGENLEFPLFVTAYETLQLVLAF